MSVDCPIVTPAVKGVWDSRDSIEWEDAPLQVVSRTGLIALNSLRGSGQDEDDIEGLRKGTDEG